MGSRSYCFTINNPPQPLEIPANHPWIRYCVWQKETGANGTIHYQGYMELSKPQRIAALKEISAVFTLGHYEKRLGTREQARAYAMKEDTRTEGPFEYGTWTLAPGVRNDLLAVKRKIDEGATLSAILDTHPVEFLKYHRGIEKAVQLKSAQRDFKTEVYILIGRPGCGKTYYCTSQDPEYYMKQPNTNWWDGYEGQKTVILDEFTGWLPTQELLKLCDRYKHMVQIKGGQQSFVSQQIFITSNLWPEAWYKTWVENTLPFEALTRRVTQWLYWDTDNEIQRFTDFDEFKKTAENDGYDVNQKKFLQ